MPVIDYQKMGAELVRDEGRVKWAYKDSLGFWTIGVGRLIDKRKGGGLSDDEIDYLLANNIKKAVSGIQNEPWFLACDTDNRRRAVVNMYFQLAHHLYGFANTLQAITQQDWKRAGACLRNSLWYKQSGDRAKRIIAMLENG